MTVTACILSPTYSHASRWYKIGQHEAQHALWDVRSDVKGRDQRNSWEKKITKEKTSLPSVNVDTQASLSSPALPSPWRVRSLLVGRFHSTPDPEDVSHESSPDGSLSFVSAHSTGFESPTCRTPSSDSETFGILGLGGFDGWTPYREDLEELHHETCNFMTPESHFEDFVREIELTESIDTDPTTNPVTSTPAEDSTPALIFIAPPPDLSRLRRVTYEHDHHRDSTEVRNQVSATEGRRINEIDKKWQEDAPGCSVQ